MTFAIIFENYRTKKRIKNTVHIKKEDSLYFTLNNFYFGRGAEFIFNKKYTLCDYHKNHDSIWKIVDMKKPMILYKKRNNDTIWFKNKSEKHFLVLENIPDKDKNDEMTIWEFIKKQLK